MSRITLVTSNGRGLGHLSRELAVGLAIGDRADVTLFSFSPGLPLVTPFGVRGEFCPGHSSPWIPRERWDMYVEKRFDAFLSEVSPDVVLFDGVAPYNGLIHALRRHHEISAGWLRRGMWLPGPTAGQLAKAQAFDFVVEPGDLAAEADHGPTADLDAIRVRPVSLREVIPALGRVEAAAGLGLDPDRPTLLFGHGTDALVAREAALQTALRHDDWQVAVVTSPLADHGSKRDDAGAVPIREVYPLVRYLAAFDAAVSGAGYNSVHELVPARIPTLFIPNPAAKTDNQAARASYLADRQLALTAPDDDRDQVATHVARLLGKGRRELSETLDRIPDDSLMGGAHEVADLLTSGPPAGVREIGSDGWRQPGLRGFTKRVLARLPQRPNVTTVSLDPDDGVTHLLLSDELDNVTLSGQQPVEHILAESTSSYRTARRNLIDEFYDLIR